MQGNRLGRWRYLHDDKDGTFILLSEEFLQRRQQKVLDSSCSFKNVVLDPPGVLEVKCSITNRQTIIPSSSGCTIDASNTIYLLEGSRLFLTCSADSVPESFFVWKSSTGTLTFPSTHKLVFANLSLTDEGTYTCQATNPHGSTETSVTIRITCK